MRQSWSVNNLTDFVVKSVQTAPADEAPFYHLRFDRVFPDDFYVEMLQAMPMPEDYRAMSGKSKMGSSRPDGKPTRAKIDLFPEYIRHLPETKRAVWDVAGRVLRSKEVGSAFVQRLAPGLKRRFGENFSKVGMYPYQSSPAIFRDTASSNIRTVFGKASPCSCICRPIIRHRMSAPSFTRCCPTAENQKRRRCHSPLTVVMHSQLPITPGIQPTRLGRK